jgi:hypothetical protein
MGEKCSTYGLDEKCVRSVCSENLKERGHMKEIGLGDLYLEQLSYNFNISVLLISFLYILEF